MEEENIEEIISEANRGYLDAISNLIGQEKTPNPDYHRYHHYLSNKIKEKWTAEERDNLKKSVINQDYHVIKGCRFCGCKRRVIFYKKKTIKRVKTKLLFKKCRFCGKVSPYLGNNSNNSPDNIPRNLPNKIVKDEMDQKTKTTETKFEGSKTIMELNFLLKGGKGGQKLDKNKLQKSKLLDLLMYN